MEVQIGAKVQAVDQLGRWEEARVVSRPSQGLYTVKFKGWSTDYNRDVQGTELREPVEPFFTQNGKRINFNIDDVESVLQIAIAFTMYCQCQCQKLGQHGR